MEWEPRTPREGINVTPTHPLAELGTLLAGIAALSVALVVVAALFIETVVAWTPASFEGRVFGRLWRGEAPAAGDARGTAAQALLHRMASHWPANPYELRIGVLDEPDPNALALPGGMIFVTRGLLDRVESENELAFVLAHELGHFRHRDHLRGLGRGLLLGLTLAAISGGSGGEVLPALLTALTETGFARAQESAADRFALGLVAREYGHVEGADRFFLRLPDAQAGDLGDRLGAYLATHPLSAERIEALSEAARTEGWPRHGALTPFPEPASDG